MAKHARLKAVIAQDAARKFKSRDAIYPARVESLILDASSGAVTGFNATIDEGGALVEAVPLPAGKGVRAGNRITLVGDSLDPTAPLRFGEITFSDDPTAGYADDGTLDFPEWAAPAHSTRLVDDGRAELVIFWLPILGRGVTGYQPSLRRYVGGLEGPWGEPVGIVNHKGDELHSVNLGGTFTPGEIVDVQIRAFYATKGNAFSVPGELKTFTLAVNDLSPGSVIDLTVENLPGALNLFATMGVDVDSRVWANEIRWEIATSALGAELEVRKGYSPYLYTAPGDDYYIAATPLGTNGVDGNRFPAVGFSGPYTLENPASPPDTTPPPDWLAAPILTLTRVVTANNGETCRLDVDLPSGYSYPDDYEATLVYITSNTTDPTPGTRIPVGETRVAGIVVPFGTTTVTLRGLDDDDNLSANLSPVASATLLASGAPGIAPVITPESASEAIVLNITAPTGTLKTEIYRATDALGTGAVLRATIDGTFWVDKQGVMLAGTHYWYRARALNAKGDGPFSAWTEAIVGEVDGANLAVESVRANALRANFLIADKLLTASNGDLSLAPLPRASRVEIRGATGLNPNQVRMIEVFGGVDYLRALFRGEDLQFFDDSAVQRMLLNKVGLQFNDASGNWAIRSGVATGQGYLESKGGFLIRGDYTNLDLSNKQYMRWAFDAPDGLGNTYNYQYFLTAIRNAATGSGAAYAMGLNGVMTLNGNPASAQPARFIIGYSNDPLNPTNNLPAQRVELGAGSVVATAQFVVVNGGAGTGIAFLAGGKALYWNAAAGAIEMDAPFRSVAPGGQAVKLHHDGTDARMEWSAGAFYAGVFGNPGNYFSAGNGAGNYGRMGASAFNVLSEGAAKENIEPIPDGEAELLKLDLLRPVWFNMIDDPARERQGGFVAEEVAPLYPEAVVELPGMPVRPVTEAEPNPPIGPARKALNYAALTARLAAVAKRLRSDVKAQATSLNGIGTALAGLASRITGVENQSPRAVVKTTPALSLTVGKTLDLDWSARPFPASVGTDYVVSLRSTGAVQIATGYTVTNKTLTGCTITGLLAVGLTLGPAQAEAIIVPVTKAAA